MMKAGFVGIIGLPNAGKSTLLNELVESKVAIVNPKPQTTRRRVQGIVNGPAHQVVFLDAPGLVRENSTGLNAFLEAEALSVIKESDVVLLALNLDEDKKEHLERAIDLVKKSQKPFVVVITKMDHPKAAIRRQVLLDMLGEVSYVEHSNTWNPTEKAQFKVALLEKLQVLLPEVEQPLFDLELFTTHSVKELAAEIVREKCFDFVFHEVPYSLATEIRKFDESNPRMVKIYCDLIVARDAHKPILIGQGGQTIKEIGQKARVEIEKLLDTKIYLELHVVVKKDWMMNPQTMKELGYVVPTANSK